ncbi:hypothetical protein B0H12DRAFT_1106576 [Mycena haematopus]|nr:hypothetical protein B0H12DRAFT_1106576 [Mycena haematopus]
MLRLFLLHVCDYLGTASGQPQKRIGQCGFAKEQGFIFALCDPGRKDCYPEGNEGYADDKIAPIRPKSITVLGIFMPSQSTF